MTTALADATAVRRDTVHAVSGLQTAEGAISVTAYGKITATSVKSLGTAARDNINLQAYPGATSNDIVLNLVNAAGSGDITAVASGDVEEAVHDGAFRAARSESCSTPFGEDPSITPIMPRPCSVSATTTSSGFAVAQ